MSSCTAKPLVYICSPYAGDVEENVRRAVRYWRFAFTKGYTPVAPHLYFPQFLDDRDPVQRSFGLDMGIALLLLCTEIWVFGTTRSPGMKAELAEAEIHHMKIRYHSEEDIPT